MKTDYRSLWQKALGIIRDNVGSEKFDTWFACAKALAYDDGSHTLTISVPTHFFYEKYEDTFFNIISSSLIKVFGPEIRLSYNIGIISDDAQSHVTIQPSAQSHILTNKTAQSQPRPVKPAKTVSDIIYTRYDARLNPAYTFDNYRVGRSNKLPHAIAEFIARNPGKAEFNPFFLYGNVGVGKTHLIQAIGIHIKEQNPAAEVAYVPMREFTNQLSKATMDKCVPDFINWYNHLDVLLMDDLQEITGKPGTMDALFPIFNHLHQRNKKLIFTCDRAPVELTGLTDRLIDRFRWGITEELPSPDLDLRKDILTYKAAKNGLDLPEDVIDFVARTATSSVREIEGIVMGIMSRSIQFSQPITVELAKKVVGNVVKTRKRVINFDMIVEATAEAYNLSPDTIFTKARLRDIADARQVIMYLAHKYTDLSSPAIGQRLNRRHATVLYGISAVRDRLTVNSDLSDRVAAIESSLTK